jgi:hypothetical protein
VPTSPRFQIVTEFSAFEGWRNCLAVDRRQTPPRPVVLSFVPARVADAPERLTRLAEDVERAARLFHPTILKVVGMETFGDQPVVVQEWRDGESLRELLDTGTRVPPEVAARIIFDACQAVHYAHGRAAEQGRPFAHGALRAERVLVGLDGGVLVSGFGRAAEGDGAAPTPVEDVKALGSLLLQCLAGEQPSRAGLPGVPDRLAEVATKADAGQPFGSADAFGKAIAEAVPLAAQDRVKAWADGVLPPEAGTRGRRRRSLQGALAAAATEALEVSDDSIVASATPVPGTVAAAKPPGRPVAEPAQDADDLIVGEATAPPAGARRDESAHDADDLIVGEATGPMTPRRPGEKTPEIAFPRPPPAPIVAWRVVAGAAGLSLVAGLAIGVWLGR